MYTPVYTRDLFGGALTIVVYGASRNWNYAGDSVEQMEEKNPGITAAIAEVMAEFGIKRALVPKPAFNALIAMSSDLTLQRLPNFWRGADADGVLLERAGDAYFLASADCLTTVLWSPDKRIAMALHCGRDALVDRGEISGGNRRNFSSVIDRAAVVAGESLHGFQAYLAAGIGPSHFTHPTTETVRGSDGVEVKNRWRDNNRRLIEHLLQKWQYTLPSVRRELVVTDEALGKIDLAALVVSQLYSHNVTLSDIFRDGHNTAVDFGVDGNFLFHSNRRDPTQRNLVVVRRNR